MGSLLFKGTDILSGWSLVAPTVLNFWYKSTVVALGVLLLIPLIMLNYLIALVNLMFCHL